MRVREPTKDQFQIHNKNRIKVHKRELKSNLRNNRTNNKNLLESPENSDDDQYHEKLVNRGAEWWGKVNHRFFREMPEQEVSLLMQRTTSEQVLDLKHPSRDLGPYFEEEIVSANPYLGSPSFVRVLFRREVRLQRWEHYELLTYSFKEYDYLREAAGRAVNRSLHLSAFRCPMVERNCSGMELERLQLDIIDVEDDQEEIKKLLRFDVVKAKQQLEVEEEIELWEKQLERVNAVNLQNWATMRQRMRREGLAPIGLQEEVQDIRKALRMTEVLLYFKRGHSDKTQQMLEDALEVVMIKEMNTKEETKQHRTTPMEKLKCLFQTDCKICFCTESDDSNQVLYCDSCNTSFHQACYGIETIAEDKFYCEVCKFIRKNTDKQNGKIVKKPACQVCCKLNFPMRQLDGHFYHITCLVLFDLVDIRNYHIEFRPGITHDIILQRVVESELTSNYCGLCLKEGGMKFKCAEEGCEQSFHPICAYLNGVHFQLVRSYHTLNSTLTCPRHLAGRDNKKQVYLRRFFCDYKGTSAKTEEEFQKEYMKELQEKEAALALKRKYRRQGVISIGKLGKAIKPTHQRVPKMKKAASEQPLSASKRQSSDAASNQLPPNSQTEITDTRRLLLLMTDRIQ